MYLFNNHYISVVQFLRYYFREGHKKKKEYTLWTQDEIRCNALGLEENVSDVYICFALIYV